MEYGGSRRKAEMMCSVDRTTHSVGPRYLEDRWGENLVVEYRLAKVS